MERCTTICAWCDYFNMWKTRVGRYNTIWSTDTLNLIWLCGMIVLVTEKLKRKHNEPLVVMKSNWNYVKIIATVCPLLKLTMKIKVESWIQIWKTHIFKIHYLPFCLPHWHYSFISHKNVPSQKQLLGRYNTQCKCK